MTAQAEAADHHLALLFRQVGQPQIDALAQILVLQQLAGIAGTLVGQGVEQGLVGIRTQGDIHRRHPLVEPEHALDLADRLVQQGGDFLGRGLVVEFLGQLASGAQVDVELLDHVDRQADGARLVHDRPLDGLADPPGRIGRKAEAALGVELLHRADKAEVALFDQIEQGQPAVDVATGDLHHQAQVALDHPLAPGFFAAPRHAGEMHFLLRGQQRREADFVQIKLRGVERTGVVDELVLPGAGAGLNVEPRIAVPLRLGDIQVGDDARLQKENFVIAVKLHGFFFGTCHFYWSFAELDKRPRTLMSL